METSEKIKQHFNDSIQTKIMAADCLVETIDQAASQLVECLLSDHKILCCGNGGSFSNAQHFTQIMLNRFDTERPSLPTILLGMGIATVTSIAHDFHYSEIFAKQIEALGQNGDILLAYCPHGTAKNILDAVETAHSRGLTIIALTGSDGGELSTMLMQERDLEIRVPADSRARILELHLLITHCLCDIIDHKLFSTEN